MTRLDHNRYVQPTLQHRPNFLSRAHFQVAQKANAQICEVKNVCIWGNHSNTQFPDVAHAIIRGQPAPRVIGDDAWCQGEFVKNVQQRGAVIIQKRGLSSACSAAKAIVDHMHGMFHRTNPRLKTDFFKIGSLVLLKVNLLPWGS